MKKELFQGHSSNEFCDQYFDVNYRGKLSQIAVFVKIKKIGTYNKPMLKSQGANLLAKVCERHRDPKIRLIMILTYSPIDLHLQAALNQLCQYGEKRILYATNKDIEVLACYYKTSSKV